MWGSVDIARSIKRYMSLMWDEGSGWEIRIARRLVADDQRPIAVVLLGEGRVTSARVSRDQGYVVEAYPVTIYAYPAMGKDEEEATVEADAVKDLLGAMIEFGLSPDEEEAKAEPSWVEKAGPFRIPLWDYAGVPLNKPGPAEPHGVIWADPDSLQKQNLEDPADPKRRSVAIEFRASIERPGRRGETGPPVSKVTGHFTPIP